jgi:serine/threonine protein kinase
MSPEQIRGDALDFHSDVYSFGCVLYELLAGKLPFTATSSNDLLNKHLRAPVPPLLAANNAVTPQFSDLVASMMAKDPKRRPANMEEFIQEYQQVRVYRVRPKPPGADASPDE